MGFTNPTNAKKLSFALSSALRIVCAVFLLLLIWSVAINSLMCALTEPRTYTDLPSGEKYDCILVLGAGLRADGSPSDMLAERVVCAVKAYGAGVSDVIIMSGDKKIGRDYDEPAAMEALALDGGIPSDSIIRDGLGYSTRQSLENARDTYGAKRVLIVTQKYHLTRALYIAERLGLDADGLASDTRLYRNRLFRSGREFAARVKDFTLLIFE